MRGSLLIAASLVSAALLCGCQSKQQLTDQPAGSVEYTIPAGWVMETPSVPLRKGQYRLPKVEGDSEDAILAVFHFPGEGGSIQSNIDRWLGQFTLPDGSPAADSAQVEERQVHGTKITVVDVAGTYNASMGPMGGGGAQKPGFRMLGAIVDTEAGPYFFKLTGPQRTIQSWEASFEEFVSSLRAN